MTEKRFGMFKSKVTGLYVPVDKMKVYNFSGIEEEYDCMRVIKALNDLEERGTINGKLASKYLEENEQLKETINELRDMDKEKDIEIEHINNIYKEFGFKGIINYAKDKLQNYGAVREVDNGLWLLATGGWSDNEFWLDCLLNWNFMYAKGHYCAITSGGGYYYTETPYEDIEIKKRQIKG